MTHRLARLASIALVLVALLIPMQGMSQESEPTNTESAPAPSAEVIAESSNVADEILTRLDAAVEASVQGVQVGAEFTWPILVRQQVIEGLVALVFVPFGFGLLYLAFIAWGRAAEWVEKYDQLDYRAKGKSEAGSQSARYTALAVASGLFGALLSLGGFISMTEGNGITKLFNPEYHALMDVLTALGL